MSNKPRSISIRIPGETDLPAIAGLLQQVLGKSITPLYLLHKYFRNPLGPSPMVMAKASGQCIAFMGLVVVEVYMREKKIRAAQEVDVAVSEQCRNLSVYLQLVAQLKEQIDRQGILLSYGVSNSNTADIARILWGKTDLAVVPRFVRVMKYNQALEKKVGSAFVSDFLSVIANRIKKSSLWFCPRLSSGFSIARMDQFGPEFERFSRQLAQCRPVVLAKDERYLNWRYHAIWVGEVAQWKLIEKKTGEMAGFWIAGLIMTGGKKRGRIYELQIMPLISPKDKAACIAALLQWFYTNDCDVVDCWAMPADPLRPILRQTGFAPRPKEHIRLTFSLYGAKTNRTATDSLSNAENWSFSMGDTDIV